MNHPTGHAIIATDVHLQTFFPRHDKATLTPVVQLRLNWECFWSTLNTADTLAEKHALA
jgi:hypothetical protein